MKEFFNEANARIRLLDEKTINQIAAGEVIENPASVIKELVENAIDARASEIFIETKAAGRALIKVADDGCGMLADDLLLSVERHATSKLVNVEDLNSLRTLGFRGEALPSIASISKMSMHSAFVNGEGVFLQIEGGKIGRLSPLARRKGTTIEVRSLFYNVPVRKKFQKSLSWDAAEIHKIVAKFALCFPSLGIHWINDGKQHFSVISQDGLQPRIEFLLGDEFSEASFSVEHQSGALSLSGSISQPHYHRPNRSGQHLFINTRSVTSTFVAQKILESYATRLSPHRFPLFALHLHMPPSWIDVNVHPQKKEVRIREEEKLSAFLFEAIGKSLEGPVVRSVIQKVDFSMPMDLPKLTLSESFMTYEPPDEQGLLFASKTKILGKVRHYFLVQGEEGIHLVDGVRAMERIVFEELNQEKGKTAVQALLLPLQLTFSGKEGLLLQERLQELNDKGISIRHFGGESFLVDAIPSILEPNEIEDILYAFLETGSFSHRLGVSLQKRNLSLETAAPLIEKLFKCKNPDFTPDGKKIHLLLDENALAKLL